MAPRNHYSQLWTHQGISKIRKTNLCRKERFVKWHNLNNGNGKRVPQILEIRFFENEIWDQYLSKSMKWIL